MLLAASKSLPRQRRASILASCPSQMARLHSLLSTSLSRMRSQSGCTAGKTNTAAWVWSSPSIPPQNRSSQNLSLSPRPLTVLRPTSPWVNQGAMKCLWCRSHRPRPHGACYPPRWRLVVSRQRRRSMTTTNNFGHSSALTPSQFPFHVMPARACALIIVSLAKFYFPGNGYFGHYFLLYYPSLKTPPPLFLPVTCILCLRGPIVFTSSVDCEESSYPLACVIME